MMFLIGFIMIVAHLRTLEAEIIELQHVQLGTTVAVTCNLSYVYDTAWLKQNPDGPPSLVISASFRKGDPIYGYQPDPRFSVEFENQSLTLTITDIETSDLGMYYCVAHLNTQLLIGSGTILCGPFQMGFYHWYCAVMGSGLLTMVICVCLIQWKTNIHTNISLSEARRNEDNCNIEFQTSSYDPHLMDYV